MRAHVHITAAAIIGAANINEMIMANDAWDEHRKTRRVVSSRNLPCAQQGLIGN